MHIARFFVASLLTLISLATSAKAAAPRPNVLVILVDDMGFSDLGCYGSEIETPNLDRLAADGLRFSQFYNTAKCHSSRISLLTGRYPFQAGNTSLSRATTTAEVLGAAGYFTAMAGKWHLQQQPTDFGFARYFGHLSGSTNYFTGNDSFRLNGEPFQVPQQGFYTTVANVDYSLRFLNEARQTKKPWYLYLAFNAPHAPLQPLEADYRKYQGRYDIGWDAIRAARVKKQQDSGLFGAPLTPSPRPEHIPAWDTLTPARRGFESRRMTALAGMIDRIDQELGRLFADLKENGEWDNTLILFFSDNGACPYDRVSNNLQGPPYVAETRWSDSTGWAWVRNSPFRYYKQNQFEGGICTPGIVHWPAGLKTERGSIVHEPAHLVDVLPTLSEICQAPLPKTWPGRELEPVAGVSLAPVLAGRKLEARPPIYLQFASDRGLREGDWKLVSFRRQPWELYNLSTDRTELHDLSAEQPQRLAAMVQRWHSLSENDYLVPASARQPVETKATGHVHPEWTNFALDPQEGRRGSGPVEKRKRPGAGGKAGGIRARRDTTLKIIDGQLVLTCTGTDSGLAFDRVRGEEALPPGPYRLTFRLRSTAAGEGEVYFTTDAETKLPDGQHLVFDVDHDDQWHQVALTLDTDEPLVGLRLDPCSAPGTATIADLQLSTPAGEVLVKWPQ